MKQTIARFFADPARARGTARELVLMLIDPHDVSLETLRAAEPRSFADGQDGRGGVTGVILRASVEPVDVDRVEATLARNGGVALGAAEAGGLEADVSRSSSPRTA
jgi:hypothetical protein